MIPTHFLKGSLLMMQACQCDLHNCARASRHAGKSIWRNYEEKGGQYFTSRHLFGL